MRMPCCDCAESQAAGLMAMVTETIRPDITHLPRESDRMVQCGHCGKILKYYGTVTWTDPRTEEPGYRTVMI